MVTANNAVKKLSWFAIVTDYYRCTNCGADTKQHINGSIRYLKLDESDKKWLEGTIWLDKSLSISHKTKT